MWREESCVPRGEPCCLLPLPGRAEERWGQCFSEAQALPPLGHGVGVGRVINPAVMLVGGHDTWRKRKGDTSHRSPAEVWHGFVPLLGEGNPSRCSDACPRGEELPLLLAATSVQRSIERTEAVLVVKEKQPVCSFG